MNSRQRYWLLLVPVMVLGCGDPVIVPVAPPGFGPQKVAPPTAGSGAEALGETGPGGVSAPVEPLTTAVSEPTPIGQPRKTASGLSYETLKEGNGPACKPGQNIVVDYVGTLPDGTKFDSSKDKGKPFPLPIGRNKVIKGWDEGIPGMRIGETRRLLIPAELGYGSRGSPPVIPPNSPLVFVVDLLEIADAPQPAPAQPKPDKP